jgi:hypothetical protein
MSEERLEIRLTTTCGRSPATVGRSVRSRNPRHTSPNASARRWAADRSSPGVRAHASSTDPSAVSDVCPVSGSRSPSTRTIPPRWERRGGSVRRDGCPHRAPPPPAVASGRRSERAGGPRESAPHRPGACSTAGTRPGPSTGWRRGGPRPTTTGHRWRGPRRPWAPLGGSEPDAPAGRRSRRRGRIATRATTSATALRRAGTSLDRVSRPHRPWRSLSRP